MRHLLSRMHFRHGAPLLYVFLAWGSSALCKKHLDAMPKRKQRLQHLPGSEEQNRLEAAWTSR